MDYNNLYRSYQIKAAEDVLDPDEQAFFRKICRWYSKSFHTPLHLVESLPIDHILTNYYESTMEAIPYNDLYDIVIEDFLPEIQEENETNLQEFIEELEAEQAEQQQRKALKTQPAPISKPKATKKRNKPESLQDSDQSGAIEDSTPNINITFPDDEL